MPVLKNTLEEHEPPKNKEKKKKERENSWLEVEEVEENGDEGGRYCSWQPQSGHSFLVSQEWGTKKWKPSSGSPSTPDDSRRPRIKKSTPFSGGK